MILKSVGPLNGERSCQEEGLFEGPLDRVNLTPLKNQGPRIDVNLFFQPFPFLYFPGYCPLGSLFKFRKIFKITGGP